MKAGAQMVRERKVGAVFGFELVLDLGGIWKPVLDWALEIGDIG